MNQFEGLGLLTSKINGEKLIGEFVQGMYHGKAVYSWPDGRKFEGYLTENTITGIGTLASKTGHVYTGTMKAGLEHGHGRLTHGGKELHVGAYVDGDKILINAPLDELD
jgi:hypothetical protein